MNFIAELFVMCTAFAKIEKVFSVINCISQRLPIKFCQIPTKLLYIYEKLYRETTLTLQDL